MCVLLTANVAQSATYSISHPSYNGVTNYEPPCAQPPCVTYRNAMSLTGTFTTDAPLEPDLALQTIYSRVTSFRFSDGVNIYADGDPNVRVSSFGVRTDSSGAIIEHSINISKWLSGSNPHSPQDRFSELLSLVTSSHFRVSAYHNFTCFRTWTVPNIGTEDVCNSAGPTASTSSAGYDPAYPARYEKRDVVEYFNTEFGHYFTTMEPDEVTLLDGGAFGGAFKRTGMGFIAYAGPEEGTIPVCRFFTTPGAFGAKSSHFYTANAAECEGLKSNPYWIYETIAFYVYPITSDWCTMSQTRPVFRMYNNGQTGAPNHRYTTDSFVFEDFTTTKGWISEGIAFCAPVSRNLH